MKAEKSTVCPVPVEPTQVSSGRDWFLDRLRKVFPLKADLIISIQVIYYQRSLKN